MFCLNLNSEYTIRIYLEYVEIMEDSIKDEVPAMEGNQTIEEDVKLEDPLKPDIHVKSEGIYDLLTLN